MSEEQRQKTRQEKKRLNIFRGKEGNHQTRRKGRRTGREGDMCGDCILIVATKRSFPLSSFLESRWRKDRLFAARCGREGENSHFHFCPSSRISPSADRAYLDVSCPRPTDAASWLTCCHACTAELYSRWITAAKAPWRWRRARKRGLGSADSSVKLVLVTTAAHMPLLKPEWTQVVFSSPPNLPNCPSMTWSTSAESNNWRQLY